MSDTTDLLIELGTEELPASNQHNLGKALTNNLCQLFNKASLDYSKATTYVTPRRLAVLIQDIAVKQADKKELRKGPALNAAYDDAGNPTPAALGFAKSCGVSLDALQQQETPKGTWLVFEQEKQGQTTASLLPELLEQAVSKLPIPKPMRWGSDDYAFIRPVHWLVVLMGEETIHCNLFGLTSSNQSYGHRFHHPEAITIASANEYEATLQEKGRVIANFNTRKQCIAEQIEKLAAEKAGTVLPDDDLLEEVTGLVEWPVGLVVPFDQSFLSVPNEALESAMKQHQKCFPIVDKAGQMQAWFITISNIESKEMAEVVDGNERVMRARLSDAAFFYHTDRQKPLASRMDALETIVFQNKLGSIADKARRISALAASIAQDLSLDQAETADAARLAKCDLASEMVFEFPELQGTMGYYYAKNDGLSETVATAIKEHYQPRFAKDELPSTPVASAVALADKIDTLTAIFAIGQKPTGDKDPFALRRAALGVIRILIENKLPLDLKKTIQTALEPIQSVLKTEADCSGDVLHFIFERLRYWYTDQAIAPDVVAAVLAKEPHNLVDFDARLKAVQYFVTLPQAATLAGANKRVTNILNKNNEQDASDIIEQSLLEAGAETELVKQIDSQKQTLSELASAGNYQDMLNHLATLDTVIDNFFTDVMVMHEQEAIRKNRLAILRTLQHLLSLAADISLIQSANHEASHT